jgi:hypothetical protein
VPTNSSATPPAPKRAKKTFETFEVAQPGEETKPIAEAQTVQAATLNHGEELLQDDKIDTEVVSDEGTPQLNETQPQDDTALPNHQATAANLGARERKTATSGEFLSWLTSLFSPSGRDEADDGAVERFTVEATGSSVPAASVASTPPTNSSDPILGAPKGAKKAEESGDIINGLSISKLRQFFKDFTGLERQNQDLERRNQELQAKLDAEILEHNTDNNNKATELGRVRRERDEKQAELTRTQESMQRQLDDVNGELQTTKGQLADDTSKLADDNKKLTDTTGNLADANKKLTDKRTDAKNQLKDVYGKLEAAQQVIAERDNRMEMDGRELAPLSATLESQKADLFKLPFLEAKTMFQTGANDIMREEKERLRNELQQRPLVSDGGRTDDDGYDSSSSDSPYGVYTNEDGRSHNFQPGPSSTQHRAQNRSGNNPVGTSNNQNQGGSSIPMVPGAPVVGMRRVMVAVNWATTNTNARSPKCGRMRLVGLASGAATLEARTAARTMANPGVQTGIQTTAVAMASPVARTRISVTGRTTPSSATPTISRTTARSMALSVARTAANSTPWTSATTTRERRRLSSFAIGG